MWPSLIPIPIVP